MLPTYIDCQFLPRTLFKALERTGQKSQPLEILIENESGIIQAQHDGLTQYGYLSDVQGCVEHSRKAVVTQTNP
jgi:hypothetical protein